MQLITINILVMQLTAIKTIILAIVDSITSFHDLITMKWKKLQ